MSKKFTLQVVLAIAVLAAVLIYLGVNLVPRIYASSSAPNNLVGAVQQSRADYLDERYPRSILDPGNAGVITLAQPYTGADWIVRNPSYYYNSVFYIGADWIVRNPSYYNDISFRAYPHPDR